MWASTAIDSAFCAHLLRDLNLNIIVSVTIPVVSILFSIIIVVVARSVVVSSEAGGFEYHHRDRFGVANDDSENGDEGMQG